MLSSMKKALTFFMFITLSVHFAFSQDFGADGGIIYGVGVAYDIEKADSMAIFDLSRSLRVMVTNETTHAVSEENGKYSDAFTKKTGLSSSIELRGSRKKITVDRDGMYTVYRYIDKNAYVSERMDMYYGYLERGREISCIKMYLDTLKHRKNLALGYLYRAYEAVSEDDTLLRLFIGDTEVDSRKSEALNEIARVYRADWGDIYVDSSDGMKYSSGTRRVYLYSGSSATKNLFAFEYFDGHKWTRPTAFYESGDIYFSRPKGSDSYGGKNHYRAILIYTPSDRMVAEYRWLFEEKVGNVYVKINVPEFMYYLNNGHKMYINLI